MRLKRNKKRIPRQFKLVIPIVFILAIMWVWKSTEATNLSRKLTELERTKKSMLEENKRLYAELENYRSVGWVDCRVRSVSPLTYDLKNRMILFEKNEIKTKPSKNLGLYADVIELLKMMIGKLLGTEIEENK